MDRKGKRNAIRRRIPVEEDIIEPTEVQEDNLVNELEKERTKHFLKALDVLPKGDIDDKRSVSIRKAQVGMRPEELKGLVKDDFAFIFYKIAGEKELMDSFDLQRLLTMIFRDKIDEGEEFNLATCRSMVAAYDTRRVGGVTYVQFKRLWKNLMKWQYSFNRSDKNQNDHIDREELREALQRLRITVKNADIEILMNKYQNRDNLLVLEDFFQICARASAAKRSFKNNFHEESEPCFDTFMFELSYI